MDYIANQIVRNMLIKANLGKCDVSKGKSGTSDGGMFTEQSGSTVMAISVILME